MEDNDKLDLIIEKLTSMETRMTGLERTTQDLKSMDKLILNEVEKFTR